MGPRRARAVDQTWTTVALRRTRSKFRPEDRLLSTDVAVVTNGTCVPDPQHAAVAVATF